jgi:NAD-dependent SIR2 family protein deacetylase
MEKTCTKCGNVYPKTQEYFYIERRSGYLRPLCRKCDNAATQRWRDANRDTLKERRAAYETAKRRKKLEKALERALHG